MIFEDYKHITFCRSGKVLTVTLNLPDKLNAADIALHEELSRVFYDVALDSDSEIIVLTGAGRAFCVGGDIKTMKYWYENPETFEATSREAKKIIFGLLDCEKPVICKMNGDAYGLGASLALFCDIIIANQDAKIADPHVRVGLVAGDGGAVIWPQLIGYARAKEFLLTGDNIVASRAAEIGLINRAVPLDSLDGEVELLAQKLAAGASKSIRWTKVSINIALKQLAHTMMDTCIAYETLSNRTADHAEAVNAFVEKRKPVFSGH